MVNNSEYISTTDFEDILNSGSLSVYAQKLVMKRFPLLSFFNLKSTQNGSKFEVIKSEPTLQEEIDRNAVYLGSETSDWPNLRFGEAEWSVEECNEIKTSFEYSTLIRNTNLDRVRKNTAKAAALIGDRLNNQTTDILFNSAGVTGADLDWTVNPSEALNDFVNKIDDLNNGFIPDTMFVRADKYNSLSSWLSLAGQGITYLNPSATADTRVTSYIGFEQTNLAIKNIYKLPATTKLPGGVDYVAFDSSSEIGYIYNALSHYEVPQDLATYMPALYDIDAENQFVLAFESQMNSNPSLYRTFLLSACKLGILEPASIISGEISSIPVTATKKVAKK